MALRPAEGTPLWLHCPAEATAYAVIGVGDGVVHALSLGSNPEAGHEYLVVDAGDGSVRWRQSVTPLLSGRPAGLLTGAPGSVAAGEVVVLLVGDQVTGSFVGFDAPTGEELWRVPADGMLTLAHADDVVVLADEGGPTASGEARPQRIRALDRRDGTERWTTTMTGLNMAYAVAGDVGIVDAGGDTVGIGLPDGEVRWRGGGWDGARSIGVGDVVLGEFSGSSGRSVKAHDAGTGSERWSTDGFTFNSMWALDDEAVYLHRDTGVVAHTLADGTERWRSDSPGQLYAAGSGRVLLMADHSPGHGAVIGLSADDGGAVWSQALPLIGHAYATTAVVGEDVAVVAISNSAPTD